MWNPLRICLFSPIQGTITRDAQPVIGMEIMRRCVLDDRIHSDGTLTDDYGRFSFRAMNTWSLRSLNIFKNSGIEQVMIATHRGENWTLWQSYKWDMEIGSEIALNWRQAVLPIEIACELNDQPGDHVLDGQRVVSGLCTFLNQKAERRVL